MRMRVVCGECWQKNSPVAPEFVFGDLHDSGIVYVTCSQDHRSAVIIQNHKFELLFESGALALLDGHEKEAVSSFAAALERFYEFYIYVIMLKHGIEVEKTNEAWKGVAKQSERQLGAFCFLYFLENKSPYELPNHVSELRNKVIHQGYIPTTDEVKKYAETILNKIETISSALRKDSHQFIDQFVRQELDAKSNAVPRDLRGSTQAGMIMIDVTSHADTNTLCFSERLNLLAEVRQALNLKSG